MTGWIKIDKRLPDKPEVDSIMRDCSATRAEAVLALLRWFDYVDTYLADERIPLDAAQIDAKAGLPGFAAALVRCQWLYDLDEGLEVANYDEWFGASAKRRALAAKRQARRRAASAPRPADEAPAPEATPEPAPDEDCF